MSFASPSFASTRMAPRCSSLARMSTRSKGRCDFLSWTSRLSTSGTGLRARACRQQGRCPRPLPRRRSDFERRFSLKVWSRGTIVEWAVHLRRFDENRTLDRLVKRNELNLDIIGKLAGVVAASHRRAPIIGGANAGQALQRQIEETLISLEAAPKNFAAQAV